MTSGCLKEHEPVSIVPKLRNVDAVLNTGQDLAAAQETLGSGEAPLSHWRAQRDGLTSKEAKRPPTTQLQSPIIYPAACS